MSLCIGVLSSVLEVLLLLFVLAWICVSKLRGTWWREAEPDRRPNGCVHVPSITCSLQRVSSSIWGKEEGGLVLRCAVRRGKGTRQLLPTTKKNCSVQDLVVTLVLLRVLYAKKRIVLCLIFNTTCYSLPRKKNIPRYCCNSCSDE